MKYESALSCGDAAWVWSGEHVRSVTVGRVQITHTASTTVTDPLELVGSIKTFTGGNNAGVPDNFFEQTGYVEQYMCNETGIGSGSVYTLGEHIFKTREECEIACAEKIKERKEREAKILAYRKQKAADDLIHAQREVERLTRQVQA